MTSSPSPALALEALGLSEATRAQIAAAEEGLAAVQRTVTQRDWLNITQVLDRTRAQVIEDGGLRLLALAWVKEKAAHGGASWDLLLNMTDEDLLTVHGFPTDDDTPEAAPEVALEAPDTFATVGLTDAEAGNPDRP